MDFLLSPICLGLHGLATVILTGKYILSALVILPVLKRQGSEQEQARLHAALAAASRPWILGSLAVFIVTGTLMMLTDSEQLGLLNLGNAWSVLMIIKHVLIIPRVILHIALDRVTAARLGEARDPDRPGLPAQSQQMTGTAGWGGAAIILPTPVMQAMETTLPRESIHPSLRGRGIINASPPGPTRAFPFSGSSKPAVNQSAGQLSNRGLCIIVPIWRFYRDSGIICRFHYYWKAIQ